MRRTRSTAVAGALLSAAVVVAFTVGSTAGGTRTDLRASSQLLSVSAKLAPTSPTIPAEESCSSIAALTSLAALPDYPTAISSATVVPAASGNPEYCNVQGMIAPQTHFDLELPVSTWQGRYLQNGCGGYCGSVGEQTFPSCDATLGGDFAMATDDEGHITAAGLGGAGLFAFNDQVLRDEYGYQSEQALYVVSKDIIRYYYGSGRPTPTTTAARTAGARRWRWPSAIPATSTGSSPALRRSSPAR
jgi:Tannase and feruloyl esterase